MATGPTLSRVRRPDPGDPPRWVLVTGGSRGIGRATVLHLAEHGWNTVIGYLRDDDAANDTAEAVQALGGQAMLYRGNLAKSKECSLLLEKIRLETDHFHGLVHCAALGALSPTLATRPNRWRLTWDTHVGALLELLSQSGSLLAPGAGVVALTSLGAHRVTPGYASIGVIKGALESLVKYLAVELAPRQINVNAICGGPVDTGSLRGFPFFQEAERESRRRTSGRMGLPEDFAPIVSFLLSPEASWIRGQVITADGGFSLS